MIVKDGTTVMEQMVVTDGLNGSHDINECLQYYWFH